MAGAADAVCPTPLSSAQHRLYFFPLPQGHGSFLPGFTSQSLAHADKAGIAARLVRFT
jgi:hypothetical protein